MSYIKIFYKDKTYECIVYFKDKECQIPHREDGPAKEWKNGEKEWNYNGKLHREDGPACERADGSKYYYLNHKEYSEEEYWAIIRLGAFV